MAAYASGAINILNLSGPELVQYTGAKVVSGKAFAEMGDLNYDMLTAKSITKIEDLKGKTLGISSANGADYVFLVATMQHYGLTPSDVTFITTGNPVNRLAALSSGAVQGVAAGNYSRDVSTKAGNILLKSNDNPVQFPTQLFIANADFIKNHGPLLKKFVAALEDTTAWIRANQATAANVCAKTIGGTVADCASAITLSFDPTVSSKYTWSSKFGINMEGMKNALAVMATLDPSTKNITLDDITDTSIAGTAP
jgi:ABC-type nitrate/sulfonate/bicarbonate transport system substrate-binding protein